MSIQNATMQFDKALADAEANLEDALGNVIHWEGQVAKLTKMKAAMKEFLSPEDFAAAPPKGGRAPAKGAKPAAKAKNNDFPATNTEFWMGCLSTTPQKTDEVLAVAAGKLGITGDDKMKVLRGRQTSFLQLQAKEGNIKSEGERANRTYFLA